MLVSSGFMKKTVNKQRKHIEHNCDAIAMLECGEHRMPRPKYGCFLDVSHGRRVKQAAVFAGYYVFQCH